jgi:penicillin-binding protein 2
VTGDDVYLTIDMELQKKVYHAIEEELAKILVSKIVNSTEKYTYKSDGTTISDILIPIRDVYFALIDNNVIQTASIAACTTSTEKTVYNKFLEKQTNVLDGLYAELTSDTPTQVGKLSEEQYEYIKYIYSLLKTEGIVMTEVVDESDAIFMQWKAETISLKDYLSYAIAMNWIDISQYTDDEYTSLSEAYEQLISFIFDVLKTDSGFSKIIYKYLIYTGYVSGTEICILLYDQGVLPYDESTYGRLIMGIITPYDFMIDKIGNIEITPAQLALEPCSGSAVITDIKTGQVRALVSYPSYDNNKLSVTIDADYYSKLRNDKSSPLYNGAAQSQNAPGSTFKIVSAVAGLMNHVINNGESIICRGIFEKVTPNPKCWVYPSAHGSETVATAIRDSCNVFFYEVGYRLAIDENGKYNSDIGTEILGEYAKKLGLATKTGVEIYENEPTVSNTNAVASAIGQGNHGYTALNLARYAATIADNGVCRDLTLIQTVVDCDGNVVYSSEPVIASTMEEVPDEIWDSVHYGMYLAGQNNAYIKALPIAVGCKSGTAQENTKKPDHATFILYAPYENPEISVSTIIRNGYTSSNVAELTSEIVKIYYNLDDADDENKVE